jgi:regulator of sigma E protease
MGIIDVGIGGLGTVAFYVMALLLVLTPIVFIHELGHFLVARWCGVKVKDFSIGFGKEIFGFYDRHGTRWRFAWIPIGGYVRFMDDDNAASFPSRDSLERMTPAEREGAFQTKPLWARAAIVAAGPIANFLLAIAIFTLMFVFIGERVVPPRVGVVEPGGPAAAAGFRPDDLILSIDGRPVSSFADVERIITLNAGRDLVFEVDRGGSKVELTAKPVWRSKRVALGVEPPPSPPRVGGVMRGEPAADAGFEVGDVIVRIDGVPVDSFADMIRIVSANPDRELVFEVDRAGTLLRLKATPKAREGTDASGARTRQGMVGIMRAPEGEFRRYGPVAALGHAINRTYSLVGDSLTGLYQIVTRRMPADQLRGPLGIAEMSGQVATWGVVPLITFVALISVAIGFFNLLPVPVLDGGHLLFYAIEAVRGGRPLSERTQEISFRIGLALVLLLFVFVTVIDVRRWTGWDEQEAPAEPRASQPALPAPGAPGPDGTRR